MITHAEYHADRPLPASDVALTALIFPAPIIEPKRGRQVYSLGKDAVARGYDQAASGVAQWRVNAHATRVKIYRPAMIGRGWMSADEIAKEVGIITDSVRQRMIKLIESGEVEDQKLRDNTRQFRWVGK